MCNIKAFLFIAETEYIYFAVQFESLKIIYVNFRLLRVNLACSFL